MDRKSTTDTTQHENHESFRRAFQSGNFIFFAGTGTTSSVLDSREGGWGWMIEQAQKEENYYADEAGKETAQYIKEKLPKVGEIYHSSEGCFYNDGKVNEENSLYIQSDFIFRYLSSKTDGNGLNVWEEFIDKIYLNLRKGKSLNKKLVEFLSDFGNPILTTNYDDMLEIIGEYSTANILNRVHTLKQVTEKPLDGENRKVIHIHGYFTDPENLVFGEESYRKSIDDRNYTKALKELFCKRDIIMIGAGGTVSDSFFSDFFQTYKNDFVRSTTKIYWLITAMSQYDELAESIRDIGIIVPIIYNKHQLLLKYLEDALVGETDNSFLEKMIPPHELHIGEKKNLSETIEESRITALIAEGGYGKSILAYRAAKYFVANQSSSSGYDKVPQCYYYSFYSQGDPDQYSARSTDSAVQEFFYEIYKQCTADLYDNRYLLSKEKLYESSGELADKLARTRTPALLIIDGLEVVLRDMPEAKSLAYIANSRLDRFFQLVFSERKYANIRILITSRREPKSLVIDDGANCTFKAVPLGKIPFTNSVNFLSRAQAISHGALSKPNEEEKFRANYGSLASLIDDTAGVSINLDILAHILRDRKNSVDQFESVDFHSELVLELGNIKNAKERKLLFHGETFHRYQFDIWQQSEKKLLNSYMHLVSIFDGEVRDSYIEELFRSYGEYVQTNGASVLQIHAMEPVTTSRFHELQRELIERNYLDRRETDNGAYVRCHPNRRMFYRENLEQVGAREVLCKLHAEFLIEEIDRKLINSIGEEIPWKEIDHAGKASLLQLAFSAANFYIHANSFDTAYEVYLKYILGRAFGQGMLVELVMFLHRYFEEGDDVGFHKDAYAQLLDLYKEMTKPGSLHPLRSKRLQWLKIPKELAHFYMSLGQIRNAIKFEKLYREIIDFDAGGKHAKYDHAVQVDDLPQIREDIVDHHVRLIDGYTYILSLEEAKKSCADAMSALQLIEDKSEYWKMVIAGKISHVHYQLGEESASYEDQALQIFDNRRDEIGSENEFYSGNFKKLMADRAKEKAVRSLYEAPHVIFVERYYHQKLTRRVLSSATNDEFDSIAQDIENHSNVMEKLNRSQYITLWHEIKLLHKASQDTASGDVLAELDSLFGEKDKVENSGKLNFKIQFGISVILAYAKIWDKDTINLESYNNWKAELQILLSYTDYTYYLLRFHFACLVMDRKIWEINGKSGESWRPKREIDISGTQWELMQSAFADQTELSTEFELEDIVERTGFRRVALEMNELGRHENQTS